MTSLKDFLASQENRLRAEQLAQAQAIESWANAVVRLIEQIGEWIGESDPHKLITMEHVFDKNDRSQMNGYVDARLDIGLGSRVVRIRPVAFNLLGPRWKPGDGRWVGRVDMLSEAYDYAYEILRFVHADNHEDWYLRSTRDYQMDILNQASFDAALLELFS